MSSRTAVGRPSHARTALGFVLFVQAILAFLLAGFGVLYASTYLFESDHSGMFDGLQVPVGIAICGAGIFATTVLLVARAHLRRNGALGLVAVCVIQLVPFWIIHQDVGNAVANGVCLTAVAALACGGVESVSKLLRAMRTA